MCFYLVLDLEEEKIGLDEVAYGSTIIPLSQPCALKITDPSFSLHNPHIRVIAGSIHRNWYPCSGEPTISGTCSVLQFKSSNRKILLHRKHACAKVYEASLITCPC